METVKGVVHVPNGVGVAHYSELSEHWGESYDSVWVANCQYCERVHFYLLENQPLPLNFDPGCPEAMTMITGAALIAYQLRE
jgi:hypothetical protein